MLLTIIFIDPILSGSSDSTVYMISSTTSIVYTKLLLIVLISCHCLCHGGIRCPVSTNREGN